MSRNETVQGTVQQTVSETCGPVAADAYREAMARLASAVHIVTTDGPAGRAGFTASAVCSVSDAPPTLLVCLNRGSASHAVVSRNGVLCVNTLSADHREIAGAFGGGMPPAERFGLGAWGRLVTGAPVLAGGLIAFDCRIVESSTVGTHDVLFCEVLALSDPQHPDANAALLYAGRRYHHLPQRASEEAPAAPPQPVASLHALSERLRRRQQSILRRA